MSNYGATHLPPPPPGPPGPSLQQPRGNRRGVLTAVITVVGMGLLGAVVAGAYLFGASSRDDEVDTAEGRTAETERVLKDTEANLEAAETDLETAQDDLSDAEAQIAACDIDAAAKVFNDVLAAHNEILQQYSTYLDNDELIFLVDWDAVERAGDGTKYSGRNTYPKTFEEAIASCGTGGAA